MRAAAPKLVVSLLLVPEAGVRRFCASLRKAAYSVILQSFEANRNTIVMRIPARYCAPRLYNLLYRDYSMLQRLQSGPERFDFGLLIFHGLNQQRNDLVVRHR